MVKTVLLIIPWARKGILWVFHVFRGISQVFKRIWGISEYIEVLRINYDNGTE